MNTEIKPIGWGKSILYFGIPTLILHFIFWIVMRVLDVLAFRLFFTFLLAFGIPSLLFLLAAFWFYRRDGLPRESEFLKARFRIQKPAQSVWIWSAILSGACLALFLLFQPVSIWIQENWISAPKLWIRMLAADSDYFMEMAASNPLVPLGMGVFVLLHAFGEEFFWRGYVFPRQELAFRKSTWIVHGFFWSLLRSFLIWDFPFILIGSVMLSYVVYRTRSTWPAIIAHIVILAFIIWG